MSPSLAMNNVADLRFCHIESSGKHTLFSALLEKSADLNYISICQLGFMMGLAFGMNVLRRWLSAFFSHIAQVVGLCSKPEMRGIAAKWIVSIRAVMADALTVRDWAKMNFPTNAMRAFDTISVVNATVSAVIWWAEPKPTFISAALIYSVPKAFLYGEFRLDPIVVTTNKASWLTFDVAFFGVCRWGNWSGFAATAFAKFNAIRGIIGAHENLLFSCRARTLQRRWLFLLDCYRSILPHLNEYDNGRGWMRRCATMLREVAKSK